MRTAITIYGNKHVLKDITSEGKSMQLQLAGMGWLQFWSSRLEKAPGLVIPCKAIIVQSLILGKMLNSKVDRYMLIVSDWKTTEIQSLQGHNQVITILLERGNLGTTKIQRFDVEDPTTTEQVVNKHETYNYL